MDVKGAQILAERIAAGKPESPESPPEVQATEEPQKQTPDEPVEIVYLEPKQATKRDVRIYVRGRDGRLERLEP
jgi:hypothetical protein